MAGETEKSGTNEHALAPAQRGKAQVFWLRSYHFSGEKDRAANLNAIRFGDAEGCVVRQVLTGW